MLLGVLDCGAKRGLFTCDRTEMLKISLLNAIICRVRCIREGIRLGSRMEVGFNTENPSPWDHLAFFFKGFSWAAVLDLRLPLKLLAREML